MARGRMAERVEMAWRSLAFVRQFFEEFVRLHPKPGLYNLYVEMAGEGFMSLFGGGRSTRAHENVVWEAVR